MPISVGAQAYCGLRDPVRQIYEICPQANNYRSVVRQVGNVARDKVTERVPYPLHFTELGKHTLYIGLNENKPVGLIQARSERSRRGLVEVVWAFDLDMRVTNFSIQRCRSSKDARTAIESDAFKKMIIGCSFDELVALLSTDGKTLLPRAATNISEHSALGAVIVRCAIKTLAAVEAVWEEEVSSARHWHEVLTFFPKAEKMTAISKPYNEAVLERLTEYDLAVQSVIQRDQVLVLVAQDNDGVDLGAVVWTECNFGKESFPFSWGVDTSGQLLGAICRRSNIDEQTSEALEQLRGYSLTKAHDKAPCMGPLAAVATEVLVDAAFHLTRK